MKVTIAPHVITYVGSQHRDARNNIALAIERISEDPSIGVSPPFPWQPDILEYAASGYVIHYQVRDEHLAVLNVLKIPNIQEILNSLN